MRRLVPLAFVLGCVPRPYVVLKGAPAATYAVDAVTVANTGIVMNLGASDCTREVVEHMCPLTNPDCMAKPMRVHRETLDCPEHIAVSIQVRAPWGEVYTGAGDVSHVEVPIDWARTGIDPLVASAASSLRDGWFAQTSEGGIDQAFKPSDAELAKMLEQIGAATDTQLEVGSDAGGAKLLVGFTEANAANVVGLSVTNAGDTPAYRVVATLRSSYRGAHGLQISFGRIDPQHSKTRARAIPAPSDAADLAPTIVAEVNAVGSNAVVASRRVALERAKEGSALGVACADPDEEVGPGQRARLRCVVTNPNDAAALNLAYVATAGSVATTTSGPRELKAHDTAPLEFFVPVPGDAKPGSSLPISLTISAAELAPVTGKATLKIAALAAGCNQQRLSREDYLTKRKRLQAALTSGALSQDEFDKYDAALVACIQ